MSSFCVQLAGSRAEFTDALNLIHRATRAPNGAGTPDLGLLKQHALPSTNVIVAKAGGRVVGAVTLFGENPFRLPLEERHPLDRLRADLDGRIAELSAVGVAPEWEHHPDLLPALYHYAICFGATYCRYDAFVTERSAGEEAAAAKLGFRGLGSAGDAAAYWLEARLAPDYRKNMAEETEVDYRFPPQKFFLVAHQNMPADVMNHLFNERTRVFAGMSDAELRVLKSIYDCGEFARILPDRALHLPFERFPRFRRFPMSCDGYLCDRKGRRIHLLVLDVSREGIKVKAEAPLRNGKVYALTVTVGVTKQSELIATTVWVDPESHIAGLVLQSHDRNWDQLIEYLEADFLKAA